MELYQQLVSRLFVIAGPCVIESEDLVMEVAEQIYALQQQFPHFVFVFKASFDKANRTSVSGFRGNGIEEGLAVLEKVKQRWGLPLLTDIHESYQAEMVAKVVDILQIPAFLCRQTDLLLAAGATGRIINVKKAQFLSAADMRHVLKKLESTGNKQLLLTERGTMFGYNNLVVDYTGIAEMLGFGYPVVMDATHSVQKPGGGDGKTAGNRDYAPLLAYAAAAVGVRGFFVETHPNPEIALSDGPNMLYLSDLPILIKNIDKICNISIEPIQRKHNT